jgi:hypothetical protein
MEPVIGLQRANLALFFFEQLFYPGTLHLHQFSQISVLDFLVLSGPNSFLSVGFFSVTVLRSLFFPLFPSPAGRFSGRWFFFGFYGLCKLYNYFGAIPTSLKNYFLHIIQMAE